MKLTARQLRAEENAIFRALEQLPGDATFRGRLYRDGVPTPKAYLAQDVRVLFVFREPNMSGRQHAHDMRREVSHPFFRVADQTRTPKGWWNWKAGMFAHAVAAALDGEDESKAFARFKEGGWNHEVVNRFAYIQIKKTGGQGTSKAAEIRAHASNYAWALARQIELYSPDVVIGCGVGQDSPAKLLVGRILTGGHELTTRRTKATWWRFAPKARPQVLIQLWHPAKRGKKAALYHDAWSSVREVANRAGLA